MRVSKQFRGFPKVWGGGGGGGNTPRPALSFIVAPDESLCTFHTSMYTHLLFGISTGLQTMMASSNSLLQLSNEILQILQEGFFVTNFEDFTTLLITL